MGGEQAAALHGDAYSLTIVQAEAFVAPIPETTFGVFRM